MRGGAIWPLAVAGILGVTVAANALLFVAARDRNAAFVEPDYYRKAVRWDSTLAEERKNAELGWRLEAAFERDAGGLDWLHARLADREGRPLSGARVRVSAIHNADAVRIVTAALAERAAGEYAATLPLHHQGLWELRFEVERGAERFRATLRRDSGGGRS